MANTYQTLTEIAGKALKRSQNNMALVSRVTRDWDDEFGRRGRKIGKTFHLRKPNRYLHVAGPDITGVIKDYVDPPTIPITLDQQPVIPLAFTSADWLLNVDEYEDRMWGPGADQLANVADSSIAVLYRGVGNTVGAGGASALTGQAVNPTPGTALISTGTPNPYRVFLYGNAMLHQEGAPPDGRIALVDPLVQVELVDYLKQFHVPIDVLSKQYKKGLITMGAGMEWAYYQNIYNHTTASAFTHGSALLDGALSQATYAGINTLTVDGYTASANKIFLAGDMFQIGPITTFGLASGVQAVNPLSRRSMTWLRSFVATQDVTTDTNGRATVTFAPTMQLPTLNDVPATANPLQNVDRAAVDNATISFWGVRATTYNAKSTLMDLIFHPQAFAFACVELPLFEGVHKAGRATDDKTGISIRVAQIWDGYTDKLITRMEMLYGTAVPMPEWAVRVQTT